VTAYADNAADLLGDLAPLALVGAGFSRILVSRDYLGGLG
jgi:hypothetical protein